MIRRTTILAVLLSAATATAALAATTGTYAGKTKQHQAISLTVKGKSIVSGGFGATFGSCGTFASTVKGQIAIGAHGKFNATQHPNAATTIKISGQFKGTRVSGSLSASLLEGGIHGTHTCSTGKVGYSANLIVKHT
jgi:hypothetical protein